VLSARIADRVLAALARQQQQPRKRRTKAVA
jgi:hypothetical protein